MALQEANRDMLADFLILLVILRQLFTKQIISEAVVKRRSYPSCN